MCAYCTKTYYERVKNGTFIKHDLIYNGFSFLLVGWYRYTWKTFPIKERKCSVRKLKNKWTDLLSRILSYRINESFLEFKIKFLYYNLKNDKPTQKKYGQLTKCCEISPTSCKNCVFYSQWLYSTCFGWQSHPSSGVKCCIYSAGSTTQNNKTEITYNSTTIELLFYYWQI